MTVEQLARQIKGLQAGIRRMNKINTDMGEWIKAESEDPCLVCTFMKNKINKSPCCDCEQYSKWEWFQ